MKNQRLQQFAASFLIVLSLLVSSASAACTCSHKVENGEHCQNSDKTTDCEHAEHQHSHEMRNAEAHHHEASSAQIFPTADNNCCCVVQPAPRAIAKAEKLKIENLQATVSPANLTEFVFLHQKIHSATAEFVTTFYLSDSFHNLTPGRAPPGL